MRKLEIKSTVTLNKTWSSLLSIISHRRLHKATDFGRLSSHKPHHTSENTNNRTIHKHFPELL